MSETPDHAALIARLESIDAAMTLIGDRPTPFTFNSQAEVRLALAALRGAGETVSLRAMLEQAATDMQIAVASLPSERVTVLRAGISRALAALRGATPALQPARIGESGQAASEASAAEALERIRRGATES